MPGNSARARDYRASSGSPSSTSGRGGAVLTQYRAFSTSNLAAIVALPVYILLSVSLVSSSPQSATNPSIFMLIHSLHSSVRNERKTCATGWCLAELCRTGPKDAKPPPPFQWGFLSLTEQSGVRDGSEGVRKEENWLPKSVMTS